jgi:hypothetical protein
MLRRLYTRVDECPREFMGEIMNYAQSKGIYGDQMWPIEELQDEVKDKVRDLIELWRQTLS